MSCKLNSQHVGNHLKTTCPVWQTFALLLLRGRRSWSRLFERSRVMVIDLQPCLRNFMVCLCPGFRIWLTFLFLFGADLDCFTLLAKSRCIAKAWMPWRSDLLSRQWIMWTLANKTWLGKPGYWLWATNIEDHRIFCVLQYFRLSLKITAKLFLLQLSPSPGINRFYFAIVQTFVLAQCVLRWMN